MCSATLLKGRQFAAIMLARLVKLRGPDGDWLARTIARRLGEVRAGAIVALHVSPHDLSDELIAMVRPALPGGTLIAADQALKSGTARLGLRLGQIEQREARTTPQTRDVGQMIRALNKARRNNTLYVKLLGSEAGSEECVGRAHRGRMDLDSHFAGARVWLGNLEHSEHLGTTIGIDADDSHGVKLALSRT